MSWQQLVSGFREKRSQRKADKAAARTGQAREQTSARLTTLEDYIDRISEVLGDPQAHLRLKQISMNLSKMNIKLDEHSADTGQALQLIEASLGEHLKRVLLITRFPRDDLLPKQDFLADTTKQY